VAEVREADDRLAAHAQHLAQDALGVVHRLEGLREDHVLEGLVGEEREAALEVDLEHVDVVRHAGEHAVVVDLDRRSPGAWFACHR
jgi:hypothetical protein